jgi:hypothetical protein
MVEPRNFFFDDISPEILILELSHAQHIFQFLLNYLLVHTHLCEPENHIVFNCLFIQLYKFQ